MLWLRRRRLKLLNRISPPLSRDSRGVLFEEPIVYYHNLYLRTRGNYGALLRVRVSSARKSDGGRKLASGRRRFDFLESDF